MKVMPLLKDHRGGVFRWAPAGCPIVFEDTHFLVIQKPRFARLCLFLEPKILAIN